MRYFEFLLKNIDKLLAGLAQQEKAAGNDSFDLKLWPPTV
jgi:hypothetical protein